MRAMSKRPTTARDERALLLEKLTTMSSPAQLSEAVSLPLEFAAAMATGRPELIQIVQPRVLTIEEVAAIYHAFGVLIETNMLLIEHANEIAKMANDMHQQMIGLTRKFVEVDNFASFAVSSDEEDVDQ